VLHGQRAAIQTYKDSIHYSITSSAVANNITPQNGGL